MGVLFSHILHAKVIHHEGELDWASHMSPEVRTVEPGTFMSDVDIAEMFLNFFLDWHLRKYAGVDPTSYFTDDLGKGKYTFWVRWNRIAMGLWPSPFCAVRIMAWLDETVFGDHLDQDNVFRWDVVELNLPGMRRYSPEKP
jgi:hypothetical protein